MADCEAACVNVSIEDLGLTNIKIYPNPSDDIFNIDFVSNESQDFNIKVFNVLGEEIFKQYLSQFSGRYIQQVDLTNSSKGVYLLELETDLGVINKKLIIR